MSSLADAVVVPSRFAAARLAELGAPLPPAGLVVLPPPVALPGLDRPRTGGYALVASRLAPEKGIDVAIDACRIAGLPLRIAGDGPERAALEARASGGDVEFLGALGPADLALVRSGAAVALVPSRSAESFGLAAAEAMAAGVPVASSRVGALPELVPEDWLVPAGDARALADSALRLAGDAGAGLSGRRVVEEACAPSVVAGKLRELYAATRAARTAARDPS